MKKKFKIINGKTIKIGFQAFKADFALDAKVFSSAAAAQAAADIYAAAQAAADICAAAQDMADWNSQFEDQRGFAALVCAKKKHGWIVISQH